MRVFREIADNIAALGLKRPITVTRRTEAGGPFYDLVCGQGRLEACRALGHTEVPALVVTADSEDCLVASLVENLARRQHSALDLLQDIVGMKARGHSVAEIARKAGLSHEYVVSVSRLLENGEERLVRAVESGMIPLSVAVEIAEASDQDVQAALQKAYEGKLLRGRKLIAARRLVERRRRRGRGRDANDPEVYHLLDGHLRLQILRDQGTSAIVCLIATDDEAYTYNKRINRIATIQEHRMILTAIEKGVPEERLARALNVNIASIRNKRRLLEGICKEAADLLKDKHVPLSAFREIRRMKTLRQIEVAELMVAMNNYSIVYARSLLAATPQDHLIETRKKVVRGLTAEQVEKMEAEADTLQREFKVIEQDYGADHLDLVLAGGYISRLLSNARVIRHLAKFHSEILAEFQKIADLRQAA